MSNKRRWGIGAAIVVVIIIIAAAAGTSKKVKTGTLPATTAHGSNVASGTTAKKPNGALTIKDYGGNTLAVSVASVEDPATPTDSFSKAPAGDRLVAVKLSLKDLGPGSISDNANVDATLIGSNGQDYTFGFEDVAGCTNFSHGDFTLADTGSSQRGCVVFEVPSSVTVSSVQFALGSDTIQFNQ